MAYDDSKCSRSHYYYIYVYVRHNFLSDGHGYFLYLRCTVYYLRWWLCLCMTSSFTLFYPLYASFSSCTFSFFRRSSILYKTASWQPMPARELIWFFGVRILLIIIFLNSIVICERMLQIDVLQYWFMMNALRFRDT